MLKSIIIAADKAAAMKYIEDTNFTDSSAAVEAEWGTEALEVSDHDGVVAAFNHHGPRSGNPPGLPAQLLRSLPGAHCAQPSGS